MSKARYSRFWALDFDRCLGDTEALYQLFVSILERRGLATITDLLMARRAVEASGGSFNFHGYLRDTLHFNQSQLGAITKEYVSIGQESKSLIMPGSEELIRILSLNPDTLFGIVTYGDPFWQELKIEAAGLGDLPCLVVDRVNKVSEIHQWYDAGNQKYLLPERLSPPIVEAYVDEVILVDDKISAFDGILPPTRGFWVAPDESVVTPIDLPSSVTRVKGLTDIVQYINVAI